MVQFDTLFNSDDNNATMDNFSPIPAGQYRAVIVDSAKKENAKRTGSYLLLKFMITDGSYKGRNVWDVHNLWHDNIETREISYKRFNTLCAVCGCANVQSSDQLYDIELVISIEIQPASNGYPPRNKIIGVQPASNGYSSRNKSIDNEAVLARQREVGDTTANNDGQPMPNNVGPSSTAKLPWE